MTCQYLVELCVTVYGSCHFNSLVADSLALTGVVTSSNQILEMCEKHW